jgi:hypothetical protein
VLSVCLGGFFVRRSEMLMQHALLQKNLVGVADEILVQVCTLLVWLNQWFFTDTYGRV